MEFRIPWLFSFYSGHSFSRRTNKRGEGGGEGWRKGQPVDVALINPRPTVPTASNWKFPFSKSLRRSTPIHRIADYPQRFDSRIVESRACRDFLLFIFPFASRGLADLRMHARTRKRARSKQRNEVRNEEEKKFFFDRAQRHVPSPSFFFRKEFRERINRKLIVKSWQGRVPSSTSPSIFPPLLLLVVVVIIATTDRPIAPRFLHFRRHEHRARLSLSPVRRRPITRESSRRRTSSRFA